jgi:hypothetical protein
METLSKFTLREKNDVMKLKSKRITEYGIDFETFARNFSYILKKVNPRKTQKFSSNIHRLLRVLGEVTGMVRWRSSTLLGASSGNTYPT